MGIKASVYYIINNIISNFKKTNNIPRNHSREKELVQRDKVELKLLTTLGTDDVFRWLPDCHRQRNFLYIRNYRIAIRTIDESFTRMNQQVKEETDELRRHAKKVTSIAKTVRETANTLSKVKAPEDVLNNYIEALNEYAHSLRSYNPIYKKFVQLDTIAPWRPLPMLPASYPLKTYLGNINFRENIFTGTLLPYSLVSLYAIINQISEIQAVKILANEFSISDDILSEVDINYQSRWYFDNTVVTPPVGTNYSLKGLNGTYIGGIEQIDEYGKEILLPKTCWRKNGDEKIFISHIPFPKPYPMYNLFYIENTNAPIFLTDSIKIANANPCTNDAVWTSWYGEKEAVEHVDWERLKNKTVYYILTNHSGFGREEIFETALAVYNQLKNIAKTISFIECWTSPVITEEFLFDNNCPRALDPQEFLQEARFVLQTKIDVDSKLIDATYPLKTIEDIDNVEEIKYLLSPVITENSLTLLSALPETGSTWLALSIAYSVSAGLPTFNKLETADSKKILYISGKMSDNSLKRRLQIISKIYTSNEENKPHNNNFMWKSVFSDILNLSEEDDRAQIDELLNEAAQQGTREKVSLLVLDNLSSLFDPDDSTGTLKDISSWFKKMKDQGCSILLVNNTNGSQRDIPVKTNIVDNIICLHKKEVGSELSFHHLSYKVAPEPMPVDYDEKTELISGWVIGWAFWNSFK